jgi:hypothetical protein
MPYDAYSEGFGRPRRFHPYERPDSTAPQTTTQHSPLPISPGQSAFPNPSEISGHHSENHPIQSTPGEIVAPAYTYTYQDETVATELTSDTCVSEHPETSSDEATGLNVLANAAMCVMKQDQLAAEPASRAPGNTGESSQSEAGPSNAHLHFYDATPEATSAGTMEISPAQSSSENPSSIHSTAREQYQQLEGAQTGGREHRAWARYIAQVAMCDFCEKRSRGVLQKCQVCGLTVCKTCFENRALRRAPGHHVENLPFDWSFPQALIAAAPRNRGCLPQSRQSMD